MEDTQNKELIAILTSEGVELDWQEQEELINEAQIKRQEELYNGFHEDQYKAIFYLGFSDLSIQLSDYSL